MVCLHGFTDTWRTLELVLPALQHRHAVLAPTLAGHRGGPPLPVASDDALTDAAEAAMDAAGIETAHLVGNSLGGYREGRRRATELICVNFDHIPQELIAHQIVGAAGCTGARPLVSYWLESGWGLDAERIECPVRIVWGAADRVLPWPTAAERYRTEWLPHADWVVLDRVGHSPQLDVPTETAQLILGFTA